MLFCWSTLAMPLDWTQGESLPFSTATYISNIANFVMIKFSVIIPLIPVTLVINVRTCLYRSCFKIVSICSGHTTSSSISCQTLKNFTSENLFIFVLQIKFIYNQTSIMSKGSYITVYSLLVRKINKLYKYSWSEQLLLEHPYKEFRGHRNCQLLIKTILLSTISFSCGNKFPCY